MNATAPLTIGLSPWVAVTGGMSTRAGVAGTETDAPLHSPGLLTTLPGVTRLR
jgi:hypothetical protein